MIAQLNLFAFGFYLLIRLQTHTKDIEGQSATGRHQNADNVEHSLYAWLDSADNRDVLIGNILPHQMECFIVT